MREKMLRGTGFIGTRFRELSPDYREIPRDWAVLPQPFEGDIINLAAYGNYYDQKDIQQIYQVNFNEAIRLVLEAEELFYNSLILISSSSVILPTKTHYSASKEALENFARIYQEQTDKPVVVVRPSSVTGIGEQSHHLIPKLISSCLYGEEIPFVAGPTHDFIAVDDFVSELNYVSDNIDFYKGNVTNLSSGRSWSNLEVKEIVEQVTGKKAKIREVESLRNYDTDKWVVEDSLPHIQKKQLPEIINQMVEHEQRNN